MRLPDLLCRLLLLLQAEVDAVLGADAAPGGLAQYQQLAYVSRCVAESMRLYPHPPVLLRRALHDAARTDRIIKGLVPADPWQAMAALVARLAGLPVPSEPD